VHRRAHEVEPTREDERVEVVVEGVAEGRSEHHRAGGTGLVVVVHDLRNPLDGELAATCCGSPAAFSDVEVAVVVVADVLLIQPRDVARVPLLLVGLLHVPVRHQLHAVGVRVHGQDDEVVEESQCLLVVAAHQLVHGLRELVRAQHLGRVQASVDPHHRLALLRERARLRFGEALGPGQALGDVLVLAEQPVIRGRGDDPHPLIAPFGGLADRLKDHAVGGRIELLHVVGELGVVGEAIVVADGEPVHLFGGGDLALGLGQRCYSQQEPEQGEFEISHRVSSVEEGARPGPQNRARGS
jgi:hypothetical protein